MKIENEIINKCFKDHVATVTNYGNDVQVLSWKKPETTEYSVIYVFYKNMIFITGDMRDAVVNCTWNPHWNYNWNEIELAYFMEKVTASYHDKYIFDENEAFDDIKNYYKDCFEITDKQYDELFSIIENIFTSIDRFKDLLDYDIPYIDNTKTGYLYHLCRALNCAYNSETNEVYIRNLQEEECLIDDIPDIHYFGLKHNKIFDYYLAGLQMAYDQLKEKSEV